MRQNFLEIIIKLDWLKDPLWASLFSHLEDNYINLSPMPFHMAPDDKETNSQKNCQRERERERLQLSAINAVVGKRRPIGQMSRAER